MVFREEGCAPGTSVELWTIADGPHIPIFTTEYAGRVLDWLFAKRR